MWPQRTIVQQVLIGDGCLRVPGVKSADQSFARAVQLYYRPVRGLETCWRPRKKGRLLHLTKQSPLSYSLPKHTAFLPSCGILQSPNRCAQVSTTCVWCVCVCVCPMAIRSHPAPALGQHPPATLPGPRHPGQQAGAAAGVSNGGRPGPGLGGRAAPGEFVCIYVCICVCVWRGARPSLGR